MNKLTLPQLPYSYEELDGVISKQILELHHDKHHAAYVNGANAAIEKLEKSRKGEIEINTREVLRDLSFNYNGAILHEIFWNCMRKASENNNPSGQILELINNNFENFEAFKKEFSAAAVQVEGSGWVALWINDKKEMSIGQIEKHNLLAMNGWKIVITLDVWEHAYYLDYLNNRAGFVEAWWKVTNWNYAEQQI